MQFGTTPKIEPIPMNTSGYHQPIMPQFGMPGQGIPFPKPQNGMPFMPSPIQPGGMPPMPQPNPGKPMNPIAPSGTMPPMPQPKQMAPMNPGNPINPSGSVPMPQNNPINPIPTMPQNNPIHLNGPIPMVPAMPVNQQQNPINPIPLNSPDDANEDEVKVIGGPRRTVQKPKRHQNQVSKPIAQLPGTTEVAQDQQNEIPVPPAAQGQAPIKKPFGGVNPFGGINPGEITQAKLKRAPVQQKPIQQSPQIIIPSKPSEAKNMMIQQPVKKDVKMISSDDITVEILEAIGVTILSTDPNLYPAFAEFDSFMESLN